MGCLLYPHNERAYEAMLSVIEETGKAAVIHPTGTGKSFIGFKLAAEHPECRLCWISPSEYIFKTQIENWQISFGAEAIPDNIIFLTYTKLMLMGEEISQIGDIAYIVLDEFHRAGAERWGKGVERLLAQHPKANIIGFSATNIRYLDNRRDMVEELFDGNIASEMTLGAAIARGILKSPTYIVSIYGYQQELEVYRKRVDKIKNHALQEVNQKHLEAMRRALEKADGLDKVFARHIKGEDRHGKFIVFCSNYDHMNEMIEHVPEWFGAIDPNTHVYSIYAEDSTSDKEFRRFKDDDSQHLKLLFSIDMLNEGVHTPDITGVIMIRPTISPTIYKQQVGRALSAGSKKNPIIFDIVNNFENLYSVVSIESEFKEAASFYMEYGLNKLLINKSFKIIDEVQDCRQMFEELQKNLSASWDIHFAAAGRYYQQFGNLEVPKRYKCGDGLSLGQWINTQRRIHAGTVAGIITNEQIERLNSINMVWSYAGYAWERGYSQAKDYYNCHGNLDVKARYKTETGFALGAWLNNVRTNRARLSEERVLALDAIGMIWSKREEQWERSFSAAKAYYESHKNLDVQLHYISEDGIDLHAWLGKQRRAVQNKADGSMLTAQQIKRLEAIGMVWLNKYEAQWEENFNEATAYYKSHGSLNIPATYKTDNGISLGKWIYNIRKAYATPNDCHIRLDKEKIKRLEAIGIDWNIEDPWEKRYKLVKEYRKTYGHLRIPQSYVSEDGIWLGKWLYLQRKACSYGTLKGLTAERVERLDALGMEEDGK